jgi:hypothetical protein
MLPAIAGERERKRERERERERERDERVRTVRFHRYTSEVVHLAVTQELA